MTYLILCIGCIANAQDISGVWSGGYKDKNDLEFQIVVYNDSLIKGKRTQYYSGGRFESYTIIGHYNRHDATVYIAEQDTIAQTGAGFGAPGTYKMKLKIDAGIMRLEGKWRNVSRGPFTSSSSSVWLEKSPRPAALIPVNSAIPAKNIKTIVLSKDEAREQAQVQITDYGAEDDDIVSLYFNDSALLSKQEISHKPITASVFLNKSALANIIKLVAESQGKLPQCTAVIKIITTKNTFVVNLQANQFHSEAVSILVK